MADKILNISAKSLPREAVTHNMCAHTHTHIHICTHTHTHTLRAGKRQTDRQTGTYYKRCCRRLSHLCTAKRCWCSHRQHPALKDDKMSTDGTIKGTPGKHTSWPENAENVQICRQDYIHFTAFCLPHCSASTGLFLAFLSVGFDKPVIPLTGRLFISLHTQS